MWIESIKIDNVTVFDELRTDFSKGINVFIGNNGTGKTHLLKFMYAYCETINFVKTNNEQLIHQNMMENYFELFENCLLYYLFDCFPPRFSSVLVRYKGRPSRIAARFHNHEDFLPLDEINFLIEAKLYLSNFIIGKPNEGSANLISSVFIPAKEMLTHTGLDNDYRDRRLPFDKTLIDIIEKSTVSELRSLPNDMKEIIEKIHNIIGGEVVYDKTSFFIERGGAKRSFQVEAEGHKKLALIERLIKTGKITKGAIIFWDEPEANISPRNVPELVDILFDLQKAGVQIFLATHDYLVAKYIEYRMDSESNDVLFHSFYREESGNAESPVLVESSVDFTEMEHNDIVLQPITLYKKLLEKGMD